MKTIGLKRLENLDINKMPSKSAIKIRKFLYPFTKLLVRCNTKLISGKQIVVDNKPELEKGEEYIFAATHHFTEDIEAIIGTLDRNSWALLGTKDQIENNFKMYGAWLNGMIYVDRNDDVSRDAALHRMEAVLNRGGSVLLYPEGGWNNTENKLCMDPFPGVFRMATDCNKKVIPVASIYSEIDDKIHVQYGEPIDLSLYKINSNDSKVMKTIKKATAQTVVRDAMASLMYDLIEKYTTPLEREKLSGDIHVQHTENRVREYMKTPWSNEEALKSEFTEYRQKFYVNPEETNELIKMQQDYERMISLKLKRFVKDYYLSLVDALQMFDKMKFAKDPVEVCDLLMKLDETMCDCETAAKVDELEVGDTETFLRDYKPKSITYHDQVWDFVDRVNLDQNNASAIGRTVVELQKEKEEKEKTSLEHFVDNNFNIINLERKNAKKKLKIKR